MLEAESQQESCTQKKEERKITVSQVSEDAIESDFRKSLTILYGNYKTIDNFIGSVNWFNENRPGIPSICSIYGDSILVETVDDELEAYRMVVSPTSKVYCVKVD
ncbi:MAG: hypothetical protein RR420_01355 [Anaerovoracaceae bacterium]